MGFLAAILDWNFRFQTSELGLRTELLYIFVCEMETHSEGPLNTLIVLSVGLMLYHCL